MNNDTIVAIVGFGLFVLSEILPFINIPTNGIFQTLALGFKNSFKQNEKDIELAKEFLKEPIITKIVTILSGNENLQDLVIGLLKDNTYINSLHIIQMNPSLHKILMSLNINPQMQLLINNMINNGELYNSIGLIVNNPELYSLLKNMDNELITILSKLKENNILKKEILSQLTTIT